MIEQDKRRHVRIDFERKVQLDFFTEVYDKCRVRDISLGGVFINGEFPPKLNTQCHVYLAQKGNNSLILLTALAKVVRHDDKGMALEFLSMSFESLLSLEMILLYQATDIDVKMPEKLPFEICEDTSWAQEKYNPFLHLTE